MHTKNSTPKTKRTADPRRALCDKKYFSLRPEPLERYLFRLNLRRSAERVYWLHWNLGYRRGDFCSRLTVEEVARRLDIDSSSVTRAYRCLHRHGLLRRQSPGRDPRNPFRSLPAVTEVLLPRIALPELLGAPDRGAGRSAAAGQSPATIETSAPHAREESTPAHTAAASPTSSAHVVARPDRGTLKRLFAGMDDGERRSFWNAQRAASAQQAWSWQPAVSTTLSAEDCEQLRALLQQYAQQAARSPCGVRTGVKTRAPAPSSAETRVLTAHSLAYLHRELRRYVPSSEFIDRMREVVWSAEQGGLAKYEPRFSLNIALKKIRLGHWTRPFGMPAFS